MVRKLGLTALGVGALLPGLAGAFGLGEITLKSALNQPLDATISLSKVGDLSVNEIIPKLASRKDFEQAGVGRVFFLTDIQFEVQVDGEGGASILLKSNKPVREPFLNFIIEVEWPQGRLLREYTVLLDPPLFSEKPPLQVTPPSSDFQRVPTAPSSVLPPVTTPPESGVSKGATGGHSPSTEVGGTSQTYGRTSRDDNLWNIAVKVRPSRSVNIQQTMLAIQDLNQDSFIDGNINLLKRGQILRIPTLEQIRSRGARTAIGDVAGQNKEWKQLLSSKIAKSPTDAPQLDASGRVRSNDSDSLGERGRLKILAANAAGAQAESGALGSENGGTGSSKVSALQRELALSEEKVDSLSLANRELSDRIASIEGQLGTSEHILELKDNQIAAMQAKLIVLEKKIKEELGEDPAKQSVKLGAAEEDLSDSAGPDLAVNEAVEAGSSTAESPAEVDSADVSTAEQKTAEKVQTLAPIANPADVDVKIPQKASAVDQIKLKLQENPMYLVAAVGVLAIVMLAFVGARRRKAAPAEQSDVMDGELEDFEGFDSFDGASDNVDLEGDEEVAAELAELESGNQEDAAVQDQNDAVSPEAVKGELGDAIGEADIYIAYGRFAHAIDLLRQAVSVEPDRMDLKMKLLEVFAETDNAEAFAAFEKEVLPLADELHELKIAEFRASLSDAGGGVGDQAGDEAEFEAGSDEQIPELEAELTAEVESELDLSAIEADSTIVDAESMEAGLDIDLDLGGDEEIEALEAELDASAPEESSFDSELGASSDDLESALDGLDFDEEGLEESFSGGDDELTVDFSLQEPETSLNETSSTEDADALSDELLNVGVPDALEEVQADSEFTDSLGGGDVAEEEFSLSLEEEIEASVEAEIEGSLEQGDDLGLTDNKEVELALVDFDAEEGEEQDASADENTSELVADLDVSEADDFDFQLEVDESADGGKVEGSENEIIASNDDLQFESTDQLEDEIAELEESLQDTETLHLESSNEAGEESLGLEDNIVSIDSNSPELDGEEVVSDEIPTVQSEGADEEALEGEVELDTVEMSLDESDEVDEDDKFGFLADTDESATKLDLARAYIDMGDKDGAKDILQEVLTEGNDTQKQDASELLGRIA